MIEISSESKTPATFVILARCKPLEMPVLALYQTKPPNAGIVLTQVSWLAVKSETAVTGITFISGSNTLEFANYFASGTGEDDGGTETTGFPHLLMKMQS